MLKRSQSYEEEKVNTLTHGIGIIFALVAIFPLLGKADKMASFTADMSVLIFGFGMLAVYTSSTLYHAIQNPLYKKKLHICDHVSIYFLIGGTYAPIVQHYVDSETAAIFLTVQWGIILLGAILKLFFTGKYEKASLFVYISLGWSLIFLVKPLSDNMPFDVFKWVLIGGLSYTTGVFFYRMDERKYAHAVWHLFVLLGTVAHYIAIYKMYDAL
jgi:hemolysin III